EFQLLQDSRHPAIQRRAHTVALFGAIELHPGDPVGNAEGDGISFSAKGCHWVPWVKAGSDRVVSGRGLDRDPAQFRKGIDSGLTAETPVTRRLDPAEGHLRFVMDGRAVDVAHA